VNQFSNVINNRSNISQSNKQILPIKKQSLETIYDDQSKSPFYEKV